MDELASFMPLQRRSRCAEGTLIIVHIFFISIALIPVNIFAGSSNSLSKLIINTFQMEGIISLTAAINSMQCLFTTFLVSFLIDIFGPQYFLIPIHILPLLCAIGCAFCTTSTQFIVIQFISGLPGEAVIMAHARLMQCFIPLRWQPVGFGVIFSSIMMGHTLASIVIGPIESLRQAYLMCACLMTLSTILAIVYTILEVKRKHFDDLLNEYMLIADAQRQVLLTKAELNVPFPDTLSEAKSSMEYRRDNISVSSTKYNKNLLSQFALPSLRSRNDSIYEKSELSPKIPSQMFTSAEIMMYIDNPDTSINDISTICSGGGSATFVMDVDDTVVTTFHNDSSPLYNRAIIYQTINISTRKCSCQHCKELFLSTVKSIKEAPIALFMIMVPRILIIGAVSTFNATSVLSITSILNINNEDAVFAVGLSQLLSSVVLFISGFLSRLSYFGPISFVLLGTIVYILTQIVLYISGGVEKLQTLLSAEIIMSFLGISIGFFAANFAFVIAALAGKSIPATSLGLVFSLQYLISSIFIPVVRYISMQFSYRQTSWVIISLFSLGVPFIIYGFTGIARLNPRLVFKIPTVVPETYKISVKVSEQEDEGSCNIRNSQYSE